MDAASEPRGSRFVTVTTLMLAIVAGFLASGPRVVAVTRHVHLLAPRAMMLPRRGRARRRGGDGSEVLRTGALFGYLLAGAGLVWAVAWWPL